MNADETGQLIYYVFLAALVGSGLIAGHRLGWGRAARYGLIWVGIIGLLLVLYTFRDTVRPASDRVMAELNPSRGFAGGEGQIYTARNDGHFYIASAVNAADVTFLVDTGASDIVLSRKDAEAAGLDLGALQFSGNAVTASGTVGVARVSVQSLRIGPYDLGPQRVSVTDGPLDVSLLGMAALRRFGSIELAGDRLILKP